MATVGNCAGCGMALDPAKVTTFAAIEAWSKMTAGGGLTSSIAYRVPAPKYLCRPCLENARRGIRYEQPTLFE